MKTIKSEETEMHDREELKHNNTVSRGKPERRKSGRELKCVRKAAVLLLCFPKVYGSYCSESLPFIFLAYSKSSLKIPVSVIFTFLLCHSHYSLNGSHTVKKNN